MPVPLRTKSLVASIAALAAGVSVAAYYVLSPSSSADFEAAVFFSLAAFIAHALAYRLPRGGFGDITFVPLLSGVAVAPGLPMVIGAGAAVLFAEYFKRREPIRVVFNAAQFTLAVGLATLVYRAMGGEPLTTAGYDNVLPFVAAFVTFFVSNAFSFAAVISVSTGERFASVLSRAAGGTSVVFDLVGIPLVFGFAYAYVRIGWAWSGALLLPLFGIRLVYKANRELQTVNEELLQLMVAAIEARDPYTSGHSQRVAEYSRIVASAAGLSARATERVHTAALLHDVGKIHEEFAPILRKQGRLTDDEYAIMKSHSEKGAALVARVSQFADLIGAIRGHHEAWDGTGYPDGLRGTAIPLWARVIAFADTVDAMTTDRPYREALPVTAVRDEIVRQAGKQFDPDIARRVVAGSNWDALSAAIVSKYSGSHTVEPSPIPRHSASHGVMAG